jgi:hypothetical protein
MPGNGRAPAGNSVTSRGEEILSRERLSLLSVSGRNAALPVWGIIELPAEEGRLNLG